MNLLELCPSSPGWDVPWGSLEEALPQLARLFDCPQDPVHHAEGDVGTHTRMVCEELVSLPAWRDLSEADRLVVFLGALLHDIAKPASTREEGGASRRRVTPARARC
jgi:hypothetical protein